MADFAPGATEFRIGSAVMEVEVAATRQAYSQIEVGGPETCGCSYCRNFVAARGDVYTAPVVALLDRLGITPGKEAEIWQYDRLPSGLHRYGGMLHFSGRNLRGEQTIGRTAFGPGGLVPESYDITDRFSVSFRSRSLLIEPPFKDLSVLELSFIALVPWVISDPEPD
jgi:hypothetical protein